MYHHPALVRKTTGVLKVNKICFTNLGIDRTILCGRRASFYLPQLELNITRPMENSVPLVIPLSLPHLVYFVGFLSIRQIPAVLLLSFSLFAEEYVFTSLQLTV